MKKLIPLIILLLFISCNNNTVEPEIIYKTETITVYVPVTNYITNVVEIPLGPVDFFLYEDEIIYTYRNDTIELWTNTPASYAGNFRVAISNVLYYLDNNSDVTNSLWLPTVPDKICISGNDTYLIKNIDPQTALNAGALYRDYSGIWKNGTQINNWNLNEFKIIDLFVSKGDTVIYQKENFTWHDINNVKQDILYASKSVLIYDYVGTLSAKFMFSNYNYNITWLLNYLPNSKSFQIVGGDLYSANGYRIKSDGIILNMENPLTNFNIPVSSQMPMPTKFCTRFENGEEVSYWLECNTGNLYRYVKSINQFSITDSLFSGSGLAGDGSVIAKKLNSKTINEIIYYYYNDILYQYDFIYSTPIMSAECEVWK